ncbi:DUF5348 domain-containing protein [Paenibacillus alkaliterrae]|nr:DUF5348 domain-containing protein [Paenibacillus alkaliterrae]
MRFDKAQQRWIVALGGRDYGLHCGEILELYVDGEPIPCRLELDQHWYVCMPEVRFNLRESDKYLINL